LIWICIPFIAPLFFFVCSVQDVSFSGDDPEQLPFFLSEFARADTVTAVGQVHELHEMRNDRPELRLYIGLARTFAAVFLNEMLLGLLEARVNIRPYIAITAPRPFRLLIDQSIGRYEFFSSSSSTRVLSNN
jgi:hypothetical protein